MVNGERNSRLRTTGRVAWRVLLPFAAMRKTVTLARKEMDRTRENLTALKGLGDEARKSIADGIKGKGPASTASFDAAMKNRSMDALPEEDLYGFFLRKKRVALGTAAFFALMGLYGILGGMLSGHGRSIVLGCISLVSSQPVYFMLALGAQLRLWQLRTRRLSKEENGGLQDFMREVKGWWWVTLDPEFGYKRSAKT